MWLDAFRRKTDTSAIGGVTDVTPVTTGEKPCEVSVFPVTSRAAEESDGKSGCNAAADGQKADESSHFSKNQNPVTSVPSVTSNFGRWQEKERELVEQLSLFRLDLVREEIEQGYPAEELRRVHNIAWHLMRCKGFRFEEAIRSAAEWVVANPPHRDEATFLDVASLSATRPDTDSR